MTQNSARPGPATSIPSEARALLDGCFQQYRAKLTDIGRASIEMSGDLFEGNAFVDEKDVAEFKAKRGAWVERFEKALGELYERRLGGSRRKGRRPDFDASISTLRVLTAFDQEKQAALVAATAFLYRLTHRELAALDRRVETLLPAGDRRDPDNPFGPPYILDAIGLSARATYPDPRIWRPFMERVVADLTPAANKVYITLNRYLADHGVLPEIKAELRTRSEFRPADDKDLIPTFSQMLHDAGQALPGDVEVPQLGDATGATVFDFAAASNQSSEAIAAFLPSAMAPASAAPGAGVAAATPAAAALAAGLTTLGAAAPVRATSATGADALFPDLDPLMALGTSTPLFNTLGHWQRLDLPSELARVVPAPSDAGAALIPLNLIPYIRAAVVDQVANPTDRITMDVIGLLFDYIFRDPSIPESMRRLFGRLQVPVLKAALLDRTFFSDRARAFFDALYPLHVAAIKPRPEADAAAEAPSAAPMETAEAKGIARGRPQLDPAHVHDFVSEMAVGTWLAFRQDDGRQVSARLNWVSPMHTQYIFTSRSRGRAFLFSPEELAWQLASGKATLVLEPVPLFDRAVSAALDTLAAQRPAGTDASRAA